MREPISHVRSAPISEHGQAESVRGGGIKKDVDALFCKLTVLAG